MKLIAIAEIEQAELTVRLLEIGIDLKRPEGKSAGDILDEAYASCANDPIKMKILNDFQKMAATSIVFVAQAISDAKAVN